LLRIQFLLLTTGSQWQLRRISRLEGQNRGVRYPASSWSKEAGFDAHLVKPVDFDTLTKLLLK
jgi:hypothetical protein